MYTIGQISQMSGLPVSTLRYYDQQGLFPNLQRQSGIRKFGEQEVEALRIIECLKASGLEISEIKHYFELCGGGPATYAQRRELFEIRRQAVERELSRLQNTLNILNYKCWYYDQAIADGTEEDIQAMLPDRLPEDIQKLYNSFHK